MYHLTAISKKLTLSPRPHRRLERQKKASSFDEESSENSENCRDVPKRHRSVSPFLRSTSDNPYVSQTEHLLRLQDTCDSSKRGSASFEAGDIQIVVDYATGSTSETSSHRYPIRSTQSDPVNPKLLTVHQFGTIDLDPHDDANTDIHLSSASAQTAGNAHSSLPVSPQLSPTSSPDASPSIFRRRRSWKKSHSNTSPSLTQKRNPKVRHSHSFSGLLRGAKKAVKFSLDPDMMSPDRIYWVVTVRQFEVGSEFEVKCLFWLFEIYFY